MADRQPDRRLPRCLELCDDLLHRRCCAADHCLPVAVDVGDDDVAVSGFDDALDLGQWRQHRSHRAVIAHAQARHLPAAGADRLQGRRERQRLRRYEGAVFAEAVSHDHVRPDAIGVE